MHINRQELLSSASRRTRRARRTTGRILVSALGFGLAYYLDTENGDQRRKRFGQKARNVAHQLESVWAPEVGGPPQTSSPMLRTLKTDTEKPPVRTVRTSLRTRGWVAAAR